MIQWLALSRTGGQATLAVRRLHHGPTQRTARRSARQPNKVFLQRRNCCEHGKSRRCEHGGYRRDAHHLVQHCHLGGSPPLLTAEASSDTSSSSPNTSCSTSAWRARSGSTRCSPRDLVHQPLLPLGHCRHNLIPWIQRQTHDGTLLPLRGILLTAVAIMLRLSTPEDSERDSARGRKGIDAVRRLPGAYRGAARERGRAG